MKTKDVFLIRAYYSIFEEGKENAICKLCSSMAQATKFVSKWQNEFQRDFFIKKMYSWDFNAKNLMNLIGSVGTKSLKRQINEASEWQVFNVE